MPDNLVDILDPWPDDEPTDGFECDDCQRWCSGESPCPCCQAAAAEELARYGED